MTSTEKTQAQAYVAPVSEFGDINKFKNALPRVVTAADSMSEDDVKKKWNELYVQANLSAASEDKKLSFRVWAYVQACLNGTSRSGNYSTTDKLADGTSVSAAVIPRVLGREIRKFFRGNMKESYEVLKTTEAMSQYPRFIKNRMEMGIAAADAFATADWMDDCPYFTVTETAAHDKSYTVGLARASRARGGRSLEEVEDAVLAGKVRVNGPTASENQNLNKPVDF